MNFTIKYLILIVFIFQINGESIREEVDSRGEDERDDEGGDLKLDKNIQFVLVTSADQDTEKVIDLEKNNLAQFGFLPNAPTKIICHGFKGNFAKGPGKVLRLAYFKTAVNPLNIILIDWSKYAGLHQKIAETGLSVSDRRRRRKRGILNSLYFPAAKKTKMVGQKTALLIDFLFKEGGANLSNIHLIGHSLGSHVLGWAGRLLSNGDKVSRLTVLDPAGPCFEKDHKIPCPSGPFEAVNENDAQFVDAIHTDSDFFGMRGSVGHVDFFPNAGTSQPNCGHLWKRAQCSHHRSVELMVETIDPSDPNVTPLAHKCDSWDDFTKGDCDSNETALLGEHCSSKSRGNFFLRVTDEKPFFVTT